MLMEILENRDQWYTAYRDGWLAHHQQTGEFNWKIYNRPTNTTAPAGKGIDLSQNRLVLISSAGGYVRDSQMPFDAPHPYGDYTMRLFPASAALDSIAFAHDHYDHSAVNHDPQVLLPLRHLENLVTEGVIGELAPSVISFMGYQPDATRVIDELFPLILEAARAMDAQAALLVPA
jgi:D-proline reductase (dithiol) PrdB